MSSEGSGVAGRVIAFVLVILREGFHVVREVFPFILVACVVFQLIRVNLCQPYVVPSISMEPTLHGDPERGDLVLVDKTAWWWRKPQRFDLVVVRNPDEVSGDPLVKRLVSGGGEFVELITLQQGDLFAGPDDQHLERVVKLPSEFHDMRVTAFELEGTASEAEVHEFLHRDRAVWQVGGGALRVEAATADLRVQLRAESQRARLSGRSPDPYLPGFLSSAQEIDAGFFDAGGFRLNSFLGTVRDVGFEVECTLDTACERVLLVFEYLESYYSIEYSTAGVGQVAVMGIDAGEPFHGPPLPLGKRFGFAFGFLDGHLFLELDGHPGEVLHRPFELPVDGSLKVNRPSVRFDNLLHMGFVGGGARIWRLRGFHDIYYKPQRDRKNDYRVEPGEIFLLGDNAFKSKDSRVRANSPFVDSDLIGRPVAIIGPWARLRWLIR